MFAIILTCPTMAISLPHEYIMMNFVRLLHISMQKMILVTDEENGLESDNVQGKHTMKLLCY